MRFVALAALLISVQSFAFEKVKFSYTDFGNDGFGRHYYACSFAEEALESHLEKLGATNVSVNCFGGIESWGVSPVSLTATFDVSTATVENHTRADGVRLASRGFGSDSACFFHTKLLKELVKVLPNVKVNNATKNCSDNSSRWNYDLTVYL